VAGTAPTQRRLRESGRHWSPPARTPTKDRGEPSWAALGRIIQETHFLQTYRRAAFLRYWLGAGEAATQYVNQNIALIGDDHPFRSFVQSFAIDSHEDPAKFDDLISDVRLIDATAPARQWMNYAMMSKPKGEALYKKESQRLYAWTDGVARDVELQYTIWVNKEWQGCNRQAVVGDLPAIALRGWNPARPTTGRRIAPKPRSMRSGRREAHICWACWRRNISRKTTSKTAVRCFQAYLKVAKDPWVYESLADLHLKQGDEAGWLASLEAYLHEAEDFGLSHGNVARAHRARPDEPGEISPGAPYAQAAAQTGAAWAIDCAAECHEGLGVGRSRRRPLSRFRRKLRAGFVQVLVLVQAIQRPKVRRLRKNGAEVRGGYQVDQPRSAGNLLPHQGRLQGRDRRVRSPG